MAPSGSVALRVATTASAPRFSSTVLWLMNTPVGASFRSFTLSVTARSLALPAASVACTVNW